MIKMTEICLSKKMVYVQQLVKRYDGRFHNLSKEHIDRSKNLLVALSFEDGDNFRLFCVMKRIIDQSYF